MAKKDLRFRKKIIYILLIAMLIFGVIFGVVLYHIAINHQEESIEQVKVRSLDMDKLIKNGLEFLDEMPENEEMNVAQETVNELMQQDTQINVEEEKEEMFSDIQQCIWGEWKINEMYYGGVGWQECIDKKKGMHIQFLPDSIICNGQATDINMYYNQLLAIEDEDARYFEVKFRELGFRGDYYLDFEASYVDIEQDVCPFKFFLLVSDTELIILSGKSMYKAEKVKDIEESEPLGFDGLYNICYGLWEITGNVEQNEGIKSTKYIGEEFLTGRNLDSFVSCRVFSVKNEKISELVELMDTGNNAYICCYKFSGNCFWDEMIIQDEMTAIVVKAGNLYWAKRKSDPAADGIYNLPF